VILTAKRAIEALSTGGEGGTGDSA
jgi:hypothetical protein